ncbi:MAG: HEPN domain-containing protein [Dehalococcoidia bacterium]
MSIEELIQEGSIHPFEATHGEIDKAVGIARRDLALAERLLGENLDWSFSIAYNAVLQACRAYMFYLGYRPASAEAHKVTFEFMQIVMEEPLKKSVSYFDQVRKKRHRTIYDDVGVISEKEARELLSRAAELLSYIENKLKVR